MYYDEYDDERPRWWKPAAAGVVVALVVAIGIWQLNSGSDSESGGTEGASSTFEDEPLSAKSEVVDRAAATDVTPTATVTRNSAATSTSVAANDGGSTPPETAGPPESSGATTTSAATATSATTTSAATATSETPAPAQSASSFGYPTSPDGAPLPLVVIFDTETITITGQVPSQAAKDRLSALAIANSKFPDAQVIDNMVINPAVPISVGVRVIELNSARFPEGTAQIRPEHAAELDRVVTIMNALPNISVLVIGHADQRGDDVRNFAISDERARAVVNYLLFLGIPPTRLTSRAAGETELLTVSDDDTALALNRRTEFIFYGLLIE